MRAQPPRRPVYVPPPRPTWGQRVRRVLWRGARIVFMLVAGAAPGMPPPPPPPPDPTEQVADGDPDERPP